MNIVKNTMYASIFIQIITIIFGFFVYSFGSKEENNMIREILLIENVVQLIEFIFYILIAFVFTNIATKDLAKYRYIDWALTTPLMLITTMLYFIFVTRHKKRDNSDRVRDCDNCHDDVNSVNNENNNNVIDVMKQEKDNIIKMVLSNGGMLAIGYLQEIGKVSLFTSNILGFGFLIYAFYILYSYVNNPTTSLLFWVMFTVWSLYGVASNFNYTIKNASYNILDVISKNFYGIFLAYMV